MTDSVAWDEKYRQVKERYNQLKIIRHTAVQADIDNIKEKFKEHIQTHNQTCQEIKEENLLLTKEISDIKSVQEKIIKLRSEVKLLKERLKYNDSILNVALDYNFLVVKCIGKSHYRFYGNDENDNNVIFEIRKDPRPFMYYPIAIPDTVPFQIFNSTYQIQNLREFFDILAPNMNK